ncbi:MAG: SWIB/MDM2 domain-containing protein [Nitrospirae bacterium]|nr:SWIB/MDM2 domain-containing protein [Nitrospirota bacterium]
MATKKPVAKKAAPKKAAAKKPAAKKAVAKKPAAKKAVAKKAVAKKAVAKKATAKKTTKKAVAKKPAAKKAKTKRAPNPAFMKAMNISPALAKIVGSRPLPRTEVVKKLWDYIKKNRLQDSGNKRNINADSNLRDVFGGKGTVTMFEMTKLVNKHLS